MASTGVNHGCRNDGCNLGGRVANFQRLIFCAVVALMSWLPCSSWATDVAAIHYYGAQWPTQTLHYSTNALSECGVLRTQRIAAGNNDLTGSTSFVPPLECDVAGTYFGGLGEWYSCPSGSTGPPNSTTHMCTVSVADCTASNAAGESSHVTLAVGFVKDTDFGPRGGGAYWPDNVCEVMPNGSTCMAAFTADPGTIPGLFAVTVDPSVNGYSNTYVIGTAHASSVSCSSVAASTNNVAPPACAGTSGMVNGVSVCLNAPSIEAAAGTAASLAAAAQATAAAAVGGLTAQQIQDSINAAALAAATAIRNGLSASAAAAAGRASGSTLTGGGAWATGGVNAGSAAVASQVTALATAAGKGSTAATAAGTAAAAAYTAAIAAGATGAGATAAGLAAGASMAGANGATGAAGAAGAVGAGAAAGSTSAPPSNDLSNFCAQNPTAAICKKGVDSAFSDSCSGAPACSGDAIECAIANATYKANCALNPAAGTESAAYDAAKVLTGNQTTTLPGNGTVALSSGSFSTTELLGTATGLSDLTVTVVGRSVTLPFSSLNAWLEALGRLGQAVTFLLCLRIVSRG